MLSTDEEMKIQNDQNKYKCAHKDKATACENTVCNANKQVKESKWIGRGKRIIPLHFKLAIIESFDNTDWIWIWKRVCALCVFIKSSGRASCRSRYSITCEFTRTRSYMHKEQGLRERAREISSIWDVSFLERRRSRECVWRKKKNKNCGLRYQESMKSVDTSTVIEWNANGIDMAVDWLGFDLSSFGRHRKTSINVEVDKSICCVLCVQNRLRF